MKLKIILSKFIKIEKINKEQLPKKKNIEEIKEVTPKQVLPVLTQEEIDSIHKRGYITAEEKVHEWELMNVCAPGDNLSRGKTRCKKFNNNCHDCLMDYAKDKKEYKSLNDLREEPVEHIGYNIYDQSPMTLKKDLK